MQYRTLGRTGIKVSEIGMGCEGMVGKPYDTVKKYVDIMEKGGVNFIDLYTPDPAFRSYLGRAVSGKRNKFVFQAHMCTIWKNGQYKRTREMSEVKEGFSDQLERLKTDYVDIGMIHYVDSVSEWKKIKNGKIMEYALELKKSGIIKATGISSHNPETALAAVESGLIDVIMFSINPCYDLMPADTDINDLFSEKSYKGTFVNMNPERQKLYETCQRLGVAITVMKAFGGGDLLDAELSPAGKALTHYQCLHYALSRPAVASVMAGARTFDELKNSIAYENASDSEKDYAETFASFPRISWHGHCMYCGHCAPCPKKINIADVTKFLNLAVAQGELPETVREHYALLSNKAAECIQCGVCESRCPFGVKIRENMKRAESIFGA